MWETRLNEGYLLPLQECLELDLQLCLAFVLQEAFSFLVEQEAFSSFTLLQEFLEEQECFLFALQAARAEVKAIEATASLTDFLKVFLFITFLFSFIRKGETKEISTSMAIVLKLKNQLLA